MSEFLGQIWPDLVLTDEEREYCSTYATEERDGHPAMPGVLGRVYGGDSLRLVRTTFPGERDRLTVPLETSGRRTRVKALTVSGDLAYWSIQIRSQSGELYFDSLTRVLTLGGAAPGRPALFAPETSVPAGPSLLFLRNGIDPIAFEPNLLLEGTQALVIDGAIAPGIVDPDEPNQRSVLNLAFHVWEFPDMPRTRPTTKYTTGRNRRGRPLPPPGGGRTG